MHILKVIFILLEVILLFNLLIFVHELGHFLAARWRGLKIDRFAIWFGKPIWEKKINGVTWCLGTIPAGGYVALPQMASMETIEGKTEAKSDELPPISAMDKIIVAAAGPLFSLLLALTFAVLVWGIGRPVSEAETSTTIGYIYTNSPAMAAGLQVGDRILAVDGKPVSRFSGIGDTIMWRLVSSEGEEVPITVQRDGKELTLLTKPIREKTKMLERKSLKEIQILSKQTALIAAVEKNGPAALGKLQANDIIREVNGIPILNPVTVSDIIRTNANATITLKVERAGQTFETTLKPVMPEGWVENPDIPKEEKFPRLGIAWEQGGKMDVDHPNPLAQIRASVTAMASTLGAVISRKSDIGFQHLSGPVGIVRIYYRLFESEQGWRLAIWFSVVLNVNLALLNLLPIPVLDGGHITLALIEGVRRKPVNQKILNAVQTSCAVVIIGYMLFVTFFDAQDWRPWKKQAKAPELKFKAPNSEPASQKQ
ncbi:MAG: regulator of sigma protease [Verrucomicrobiales bacterium]|nr:regulator of sigma protease [Verrucomicrobiales bacterium]